MTFSRATVTHIHFSDTGNDVNDHEMRRTKNSVLVIGWLTILVTEDDYLERQSLTSLGGNVPRASFTADRADLGGG